MKKQIMFSFVFVLALLLIGSFNVKPASAFDLGCTVFGPYNIFSGKLCAGAQPSAASLQAMAINSSLGSTSGGVGSTVTTPTTTVTTTPATTTSATATTAAAISKPVTSLPTKVVPVTTTSTLPSGCTSTSVWSSTTGGPCGSPTVTLTASPTSVNYGGSSVLTWSSLDSTSCSVAGGNGVTQLTTGNQSGSYSTGALTSVTTFTATCTNSLGTGSTSVTVNVSGATTKTATPVISSIFPTSVSSHALINTSGLSVTIYGSGFLGHDTQVWLDNGTTKGLLWGGMPTSDSVINAPLSSSLCQQYIGGSGGSCSSYMNLNDGTYTVYVVNANGQSGTKIFTVTSDAENSTLPIGCTSTTGFSTATGQPCGTTVPTDCAPGDMFSATTGQRCVGSNSSNLVPVVGSFSPATVHAGDTVTIYGSNFSQNAQARLYEAPITPTFISNDGTILTFVVPSYISPGKYTLAVIQSGQTSVGPSKLLTVTASTLPVGCTSTSGFSTATGLSCGGTVTPPGKICPAWGCNGPKPVTPISSLPVGCTSTSGFSLTTGIACGGTTQAPTVSLTTDNANVSYGGSTTLHWNIAATSVSTCSASGGTNGWSTSISNTSGSFNTGSLTSTTVYNITCTNSAGSVNASVVVNVPAVIVPACTSGGFDPLTGFKCGCSSISGFSSKDGSSCSVY